MKWSSLPVFIRGRVRQRKGSAVKGIDHLHRGYDQSDIRPLQFGDPPRSLSRRHLMWSGELMVQEKRPDRMGVVLFLVDMSISQSMGAVRAKCNVVTDVTSGLGTAFLSRGHSVRLVAFTDRIEMQSRIIASRQLWDGEMYRLSSLILSGRGTNLNRAIERVVSLNDERPIDFVCIISDFLLEDKCCKKLRYLSDDLDVIAICVSDPMEHVSPPIAGTFVFTDAETGQTIYSSGVEFEDSAKYLNNLAIDYCNISTEDTEEKQFTRLSNFFLERVNSNR